MPLTESPHTLLVSQHLGSRTCWTRELPFPRRCVDHTAASCPPLRAAGPPAPAGRLGSSGLVVRHFLRLRLTLLLASGATALPGFLPASPAAAAPPCLLIPTLLPALGVDMTQCFILVPALATLSPWVSSRRLMPHSWQAKPTTPGPSHYLPSSLEILTQIRLPV